MRLVTTYGEVWKLTERAYKKMLQEFVTTGTWDLHKHGKTIGVIEQSMPDFTVEEAQGALDNLARNKTALDNLARNKTARVV